MKQVIELKVNKETYEVLVEHGCTLIEVLREQLGFIGVKEGCSLGACGTCTVLAEGRAVLACLMLAVDAQGKEITTIEGLAKGNELHPLQTAFVEKGAVQCGFCTPGMILSAKALLDENSKPSESEVRRGISGNFCRCTGYVKQVEAILSLTEKGG